jgi:predicted membrane-bound mannosyltransferase/sugar lactone lactonase YvrE
MMPNPEKPSILDTPLKRWFPLNMETLLVVLLLAVAIVSRFYDLGSRVISHDENNHFVPSFSLYSGDGYRYDPMSHGPFQFHMMALSFALFGDNDFTGRLPAAVLNIATIMVAIFAFRRYLGRTGALVAGVLIIISPLMLFYARYARSESYIVLWGILTLYAILRYLERGEGWALFLFTAVNMLHFTDKATSYIFAAEEVLFLAAYFIDRISSREWTQPRRRANFLLGLALTVVMVAAAAGFYLSHKPTTDTPVEQIHLIIIVVSILAAGGAGTLAWAGVELVRGLGWAGVKSERSADLLVLLVTFLLPLLSAIPFMLSGYNALDYTSIGMLRVAGVAAVLGAMGIALGLGWFGRKWLFHAGLFFVPFVVLYSSFFTNPEGILGGLVGALSYWSEQQAVNRGSQPLYYYVLLMIPMYEFLPALGTVVAAGIASFARLWQIQPGQPFTSARTDTGETPVPVAALLVFWSVSSLAAFTYAGEKMPWLTIHITLPMILSSAWAFGWMVETVPWGKLAAWGARNYARLAALVLFGFLALLTGRDAYRAAYINYNGPTEYLVYAHGAPTPKVLFGQIEELSIRTTGTTNMVAAYDNQVRYPYWWYMRRYPNKIDYDVNPTRDLSRALVIAVGDDKLTKLIPVVRQNYFEFAAMRLWWPNEDYKSISWSSTASERNTDLKQKYASTGTVIPPMTIPEYIKYAWRHIQPFFTDATVRSAVLQIWLNDDFTQWGALKNSTAYTLTDWGVSDRMHYYIRKDIAAQLWPYGAEAQALTPPTDPYAAITVPVSPDLVIGKAGSEPGQFQAPRAIAVAADGSLYVVDSMNNRIQHLSATGQVLHVWGTQATVTEGAAPGGTFNEPWGVAVGPDGSVYVADTWNHRIQKFTTDGTFVTMWGYFGQGDTPEAFYGPRGIAVDARGQVFVADTGNKRIVVFGPNGEYITQFGSPGMDLGHLDEPVAVALDAAGNVYVTDTWNQRIQVFSPDPGGASYTAIAQMPVDGWNGQSVENKPFIAVGTTGNVSVTDPEMCRVITFSTSGQPLHVREGCAAGTFLLPSGIASDGIGGMWVTDAGNQTLIHFKVESP